MDLIELSDYSLSPDGIGNGLDQFHFALSKGDVFSIQADSYDDAHLFLKALAMLELPVKGTYRFMGEKIDFSDYRNLLPYKKKIGYVASDSGMISNRTVRENLLLMRSYFENSPFLAIDENIAELCRLFDIQNELDMRPAALDPLDLQSAILIRELSKSPDILLLDCPESLISRSKFDLLFDILKGLLNAKLPIVFISYETEFIEEFSNKKVLITGRSLTTVCDAHL